MNARLNIRRRCACVSIYRKVFFSKKEQAPTLIITGMNLLECKSL